MSYILEALRKSQQDRELGRVPTLATQPLFTPRDGSRNSWIGIALGLAALAVAIALYAVLRAGPEIAQLGPAPMAVPVPAQSPNLPLAGGQPSSAAQPLASAQPLVSTQPSGHAQPLAGGQPAFTAQPVAGANAPNVAAPTPAAPHLTGQATAQPHAQVPPQAPALTTAAGTVASAEGGANWPAAQVPGAGPAGVSPAASAGPLAGAAPPAATGGQPSPPPTSVPVEQSPPASGYGASPAGQAAPPMTAMAPETTEVDADEPPYAGGPGEPHPSYPPPAPPARTATRQAPADAIPEDLRQDIEAFKEQLKEGKGGKSPSQSKASTRQQQVPLRESRLPPEVQERLPSFLLTVHLYDAEPAKRLVIIDGRRLRQGDATRSGILVEEIFPDGVALAFEGHRFFQPR